jgi:hypothetical protein
MSISNVQFINFFKIEMLTWLICKTFPLYHHQQLPTCTNSRCSESYFSTFQEENKIQIKFDFLVCNVSQQTVESKFWSAKVLFTHFKQKQLSVEVEPISCFQITNRKQSLSIDFSVEISYTFWALSKN